MYIFIYTKYCKKHFFPAAKDDLRVVLAEKMSECEYGEPADHRVVYFHRSGERIYI
jgi:hypothetical protein